MFNKLSKYFLGESTKTGFCTSFKAQISQEGFFTYILKGGPGTGKSGLMKKVALEFSDSEDIDLYFCSSDPASLDAIVLKKSKVIIVDGTAPHVFDPDFPGIYQEIINLGECWNSEILKENREYIINCVKENAVWHERCRRYKSAISAINNDIYTIGEMALNIEKFHDYLSRFSKKILKKHLNGEGKIAYKKLSALTMNGYITQEIEGYQTIVLKDTHFAATDFFIQNLSDIANSNGYDVIVSTGDMVQNSIFEHMIIPEINFAIVSSNYFNTVNIDSDDIIDLGRFYQKDILLGKKQRYDFSKKAVITLKAEACQSLAEAKAIHDKLEDIYISAMDFTKIDIITEKVIGEIYKIL